MNKTFDRNYGNVILSLADALSGHLKNAILGDAVFIPEVTHLEFQPSILCTVMSEVHVNFQSGKTAGLSWRITPVSYGIWNYDRLVAAIDIDDHQMPNPLIRWYLTSTTHGHEYELNADKMYAWEVENEDSSSFRQTAGTSDAT